MNPYLKIKKQLSNSINEKTGKVYDPMQSYFYKKIGHVDYINHLANNTWIGITKYTQTESEIRLNGHYKLIDYVPILRICKLVKLDTIQENNIIMVSSLDYMLVINNK